MTKPLKDSKLWRPKELRHIADLADVDPKTVARFLDGEKPLQERTKARIVSALKSHARKAGR
jgi:DNA-binding LacI/PurR family transcriptional regulator